MSKDKKLNVKVPVDIVEKIDFISNWIISTITFWDLNHIYPTNLIQDSCKEIIRLLKPYWNDPFEISSTRSEINDK